METGIALLNIDRGQIDRIGDQLSRLPGVEFVYSVKGPYDLVAIIRATDQVGLERLVEEHMAKVEGVTKANGLQTDNVYTRRDTDGYYVGGLGP